MKEEEDSLPLQSPPHSHLGITLLLHLCLKSSYYRSCDIWNQDQCYSEVHTDDDSFDEPKACTFHNQAQTMAIKTQY